MLKQVLAKLHGAKKEPQGKVVEKTGSGKAGAK